MTERKPFNFMAIRETFAPVAWVYGLGPVREMREQIGAEAAAQIVEWVERNYSKRQWGYGVIKTITARVRKRAGY